MKRHLHNISLLLCAWLLAMAGALAQTPVAAYNFSGNAQDNTSNGNNAAVHGATLTQDRFGFANSAFHFDGVQAYLEVANSAVLNTNLATVSFWVKADEIPAQGEVYLLSFGGWQERYKVSLPNHGKLVWTTNNGPAGISDMDAGNGNELATGVWKHLVFVHDGTNDKIYINGVQVATKAVTGNLASTTKPLGIGYNPIDGGNFFKGSIDDILILNGALNAAQVAALYANQNVAPSAPPGVVAYYRFEGNTNDESGFANTGVGVDLTPTTDRFGYGNNAYDFNGSSSQVTASNSALLNSPMTTISFWVNPASLPASGEVYLLSNGGYQDRWKISMPNHGKPVFTTHSGGACCSDLDSGTPLTVGTWTHVVMVHDGAKDIIYFNGVKVNEKNAAGSLDATTKPLGIGYDPIDNNYFFDGALDDVLIYNIALSGSEVAALYTTQSTFFGSPTDLVADYPFSGDTDDATQFDNDAFGNATLTTDRFGYASGAYHFDGTQYLEAANSIQLQSDFTTISFWVKPDEFPASGEVYLLSNGGYQERWKISMPSHGKPVFTTHSNGACCSDLDSGTPLTVGTWTHVVMVHDGAKDIIYFNGVKVNEKNTVGALDPTTQSLGMGFDPINTSDYFKGSLDEVRVYNLALTPAQIAALYAAQNATPNITDELVANYTFDGNANDQTPFHNHAVVNGAQLDDDRFGRANRAYAFDGVNDYAQAANSPQLNSGVTTISYWINPASLPPSGEVYLLSHGGYQERWKISMPNHGKPVFTTHSGGACCSDLDSGTPLTVGTWTHVVMVHDGAKDIIYFNGVKVNEKNSPGMLDATTKPLGMGYDPIDQNYFFNGSLDEVQIYNVALTPAEIAALYLAQSTLPTPTDTEAPSAPLNLSALVNFNNVTLSWWPSTDNVGVTGYNIYQDGVKIATTTANTLYLPGLAPLTTFTFGVSAVDAEGNESFTTTLDVTTDEDETPDVIPPSVPGNLSAATGAHSVLLSWDASTDNVAVKGYVVLVDGVVYDTLAANATSALVGNLDAETPYSFEVYAYDNAGNNSATAELTVSTDEEIDTGEPGLVAYYPFEGNANDATPYLNHGVIGGNPTFETAAHPNGGSLNIKFDGAGDSIIAPNAVQLISDFTTVSFWVRADGIPVDAESYILDFGHWSERWKISLPQHLKIVWTTNGNTVQFPTFISDMDSGDGNEMTQGFWWYVTMVHDGVSDIIYVNGEQANIKPVPTKLNSTGRPLGMGNNPIEGGQYFKGGLDELKIYNKALTAGEIQQLFNTGTTDVKDGFSAEVGRYIQNVSPNPATDRLWVQHTFDRNAPLLFRVTDVQGRQIDAIRFDKNEVPSGQFSVDVHTYPAGTYFLNVIMDGRNIGSVKFDKK